MQSPSFAAVDSFRFFLIAPFFSFSAILFQGKNVQSFHPPPQKSVRCALSSYLRHPPGLVITICGADLFLTFIEGFYFISLIDTGQAKSNAHTRHANESSPDNGARYLLRQRNYLARPSLPSRDVFKANSSQVKVEFLI